MFGQGWGLTAAIGLNLTATDGASHLTRARVPQQPARGTTPSLQGSHVSAGQPCLLRQFKPVVTIQFKLLRALPVPCCHSRRGEVAEAPGACKPPDSVD